MLISAVLFTFFSCKKIDTPRPAQPGDLTPTIISVSPEKSITGSTITIGGTNFGTDLSQVTVTLNEKSIPASSVSPTNITAKIPYDLIIADSQVFTLQVKIGAAPTNTIQIKIIYVEPKGWFYAATIPRWFNGGNLKDVKFPSDSIGYLQHSKEVMYKTTDGGLTWKEDEKLFLQNLSLAVYDNNNAWVDYGDNILSTNDGQNWKGNRMDTITTIPDFMDGLINGLYMSSSIKGQMMKSNGRLYYINGSFARPDIITEYVSIYSTKNVYWWKMSNIDEFNLIISGHAILSFGESSKPVIAHKKSGIFNEYDFSNYSSATYIKAIQLVSPDTAFLIDGNNDLFKLNGGTNWIKLAQKAEAMFFINSKLGYIFYGNKIIKTTDGGLTWQDEFTLNTGEKIYSITAKNGKVWAVGNNAEGDGIVLKFNP